MDEQPIVPKEILAVAHEEKNHRLVTFIVSSMAIAIVLVLASLALYVSSGAEQLDLSRPGLAQVRQQVQADNQTLESFPSDGVLDEKSLSEFAKMYDKAAEQINKVKAFNDDPLSPASLQIDAKSANTNTTLGD